MTSYSRWMITQRHVLLLKVYVRRADAEAELNFINILVSISFPSFHLCSSVDTALCAESDIIIYFPDLRKCTTNEHSIRAYKAEPH